MCNKCSGNKVIYNFWVNHKIKKVANDWVYCSTCYPDNRGCYECPWDGNDCEEIACTEYYGFLKQGYMER